jgi:hypothetical protein
MPDEEINATFPGTLDLRIPAPSPHGNRLEAPEYLP